MDPGNDHYLCYVQLMDAFLLLNATKLKKIFRDGSEFNIGLPGSGVMGSRVLGRPWWTYSASFLSLFSADEITGQPYWDILLNPNWPIPYDTCGIGDYLDDQRGLLLHGGYWADIYDLNTGTRLARISMGWWVDGFSYAGQNQVLAYNKSGGHVALLDYVSQTILWQSTVSPFTLLAYDNLHDLIVTLQSDGLIRIYLLTAIPASLSAPVFDPATVHCLQGHQATVRLTGDQGEPCGGYTVDWSLAGAKGWLEHSQSQTDNEGYASIFYFGPRSGSGTETLQAQVTI